MPAVSSFVAPLVAAAALGFIVLICRWVFSTDHRTSQGKLPTDGDYGLLAPVATVRTRADAEMLQEILLHAGVRAGISEEADGLQVLVFSKDLPRARALVAAS
ncbi:MAG: hypothetical protein JWM02_399 [Frankiales bacterium]|nr:hypothetical protein [Frankiales bacterium]